METLRPQARRAMGREEELSAAILDSQSITTGPVRGGERGFDKGKTIWGRNGCFWWIPKAFGSQCSCLPPLSLSERVSSCSSRISPDVFLASGTCSRIKDRPDP